MRKMLLVFAALLMLSLPSTGMGSGIDSPFVIDNVPNVFGVGIASFPDYLGSDDYTLGAAPFIRYTFSGQEQYIQLWVTELSVNILNHPNWGFGPVLNYRIGRDDDVEDNVVERMREIDDTVELGAFLSYTWKDERNPRHRFIVSTEYLGDIGDEHDGWLAMASIRYWLPVSQAVDILVGVGGTYADSDYMNTYFGVNSADAARTGLPLFDADSGFRDVNATIAGVIHFSRNWHVGIGLKYFGLTSDAADSPIVDDRGSESQFIAGLGVAYSW